MYCNARCVGSSPAGGARRRAARQDVSVNAMKCIVLHLIQFAGGRRVVGVRLDKKYNGQGPNGGACDGKEQGERYFRCDAGFDAFVPLATDGGASSMTAMIAGRRRRGRRAGRLRRRGGGATTTGCFSRRSARGSTRSRTAPGGVVCHCGVMVA